MLDNQDNHFVEPWIIGGVVVVDFGGGVSGSCGWCGNGCVLVVVALMVVNISVGVLVEIVDCLVNT